MFPKYEVSSLGRIRRQLRYKALCKSSKGYLYVGLMRNGKQFKVSVARLVAMTFISNPHNKPQVNHINGIKTDNRIVNLEWVTNQENRRYAVTHRLHCYGERMNSNKLTIDEVKQIKETKTLTHTELAKQFNVNQSTITRIKNNKIWRQL
jgi:hypothetical protein